MLRKLKTLFNPLLPELFQPILAGLLVGIGTTFDSGCTSGHGICGLAYLSPRSIAATLTFAVGLAFWQKSLLYLPVVLWLYWRYWLRYWRYWRHY